MEVRLGTPLTADMVREQKPDAVIVATGSRPSPTGIWGSGHNFVVDAADVLEGKVSVGESVAVIGGGMVGCETANHLAHHGKKPVIVEMLSDLAPEEPRDMMRFLMESLEERKVSIHTDSKVMAIDADGCVQVSRDGEVIRLGPFDNVILAGGMRPVNGLAGELEGMVGSLSVVGDAVAVRTVLEAIEEGYEAALEAAEERSPAPKRTGRLDLVQPVAHSLLGHQVPRVCGVVFQLLAQTGDIDPQVMRLRRAAEPPHLAQQVAMRQDPARVADEGGRSRYSIGVRWTIWPLTSTNRRARSTESSPVRKREASSPPASFRTDECLRATATRASSSGMPKGLVT